MMPKCKLSALVIIGLMTATTVYSQANDDEAKKATEGDTTKTHSSQQAAKDVTNPSSFPEGRFKNPTAIFSNKPKQNAQRNAYFGDLHVHTSYSFDAFAFGAVATPYDAYEYARGGTIKHPGGFDLKLRKPLDFYAVTDHASFLGAARAASDASSDFSKYKVAKVMQGLNSPENSTVASIASRIGIFRRFLPELFRNINGGTIDPEVFDGIAFDAWTDTIKAAEQYNKPGEFTTFVAYEYTTSSNDSGNLHRNVIFRGADNLPSIPFGRIHSQNPEDLWDWMDGLRGQGIESLAIPHNSNGSNGQMFKLVDWAENPMDDNYAKKRMRNEPLVEITQIKGTSETHPVLSDNDEWAGFEIADNRVATTLPSEPKGSYVREALMNGLALEDKGVANPYKFGFIGSSDTHVGATTDDESNYFSKIGLIDSTPTYRGSVPLTTKPQSEWTRYDKVLFARSEKVDGEKYYSGSYQQWGASGIAGVWAEENTREAIYDAMRRKETFATSGPRLRVRFFASFDFDNAMLNSKDMVTRAYAEGVSMGSDLMAKESKTPSFIVWATQDASSAPLQRLQVVKGWTSNGENHEMVYDVACSDGASVNPKTNRCSDNNAKVDLKNCAISTDVGDAELKTVWKDPDYDPKVRAFYYTRVLENPSCRWSTWDAIRAGVAPRADLAATIQERAWSSPIWLMPN